MIWLLVAISALMATVLCVHKRWVVVKNDSKAIQKIIQKDRGVSGARILQSAVSQVAGNPVGREARIRARFYKVVNRANLSSVYFLYSQKTSWGGRIAVSYPNEGTGPDMIHLFDFLHPTGNTPPFFSEDEVEGILAHEAAHLASPLRLHTRLARSAVHWFLCFIFWAIGAVTSFLAIKVALLAYSSHGAEALIHVQWATIICLTAITLAMVSTLLLDIIGALLKRKVEYEADRRALVFTQNPKMLIRALRKVELLRNRDDTIALTAHDSLFQRLTATHPPTRKRIRALCKEYLKMKREERPA